MELHADWSYRLAQAVLDAAVSCGASCDRRFVTEGPLPEGLPPDCPCQLVATVEEGVERPDPTARCSFRWVATVRLYLDLCSPVPGSGEVPDPVKEATHAREASILRWAMTSGVLDHAARGIFVGPGYDDEDPMPPGIGGCSSVSPTPWRATVRTGGSTRWESTWRFTG